MLQWISEHGEAFLAKYTGIGKSLQRATQLRKRHEDFEDVAQNTYTNAEKLLEAAEQLAQNGDCDPHEIFQVSCFSDLLVKFLYAGLSLYRRCFTLFKKLSYCF